MVDLQDIKYLNDIIIVDGSHIRAKAFRGNMLESHGIDKIEREYKRVENYWLQTMERIYYNSGRITVEYLD